MAFNKQEILYKFYNNWYEIPNTLSDLKPILELCCTPVETKAELNELLIKAEKQGFESDSNKTTLQVEMSIYYAHSMGLLIESLCNLLDCGPDGIYSIIALEKKAILQISMSIAFYYLLLNVPDLDEKLTDSQREDFLNDGYVFDYDVLKRICWNINESDYQEYINFFAFDLSKNSVSNVREEQLFKLNNVCFIFDLRDFLRYVNIRFEQMVVENSSSEELEIYRTKKGRTFEKRVCSLLAEYYPQTRRNLYYFVDDSRNELDIALDDPDWLLVGECKSGTVVLSSQDDDEVIKRKVVSKAKKAYETLQRFNDYYDKKEHFVLAKGNKDPVLEGACNKPLILLNVTMDSFETLAPNMHLLHEGTIPPNRIITISFEHLFAILFDCHRRSISAMNYFLKRIELIEKLHDRSLDINELDIYTYVTDKYGPSLFNELLEAGVFEAFPQARKIGATFHSANGEERSPANEMMDEIDNVYLNAYIPNAKKLFGINKKYINLLKKVLEKYDSSSVQEG